MATRCCWYDGGASLGAARVGTLHTPHGAVQTPAFMPVGTRGSVKGVTPGELKQAGTGIVLANTYHLWERPGHERIRALGGLHRFMGWDGPMLTDSGGYQVFSLRHRLKIEEAGVTFRSPTDGELRHLSPELAVEIQEAFGVDVAMAFDECVEWPATRDRTAQAMDRTTRWLARCQAARQAPERTALFGIVQGGMFADLRVQHAQELAAMDLDGIAVGGLSVGEGHDAMMAMLDVTMPCLPTSKVRYLMGVGHPEDIIEAVVRGVDLFDCVLPTRMGRHGQAYTWEGRINIKNARFRDDPRPLDPGTPSSPANAFSRAYLCHLMRAGEMLAPRLLALHNLHLFQQLLTEARAAISSGDAVALEALRARARRASRPAGDRAPVAHGSMEE